MAEPEKKDEYDIDYIPQMTPERERRFTYEPDDLMLVGPDGKLIKPEDYLKQLEEEEQQNAPATVHVYLPEEPADQEK